MYLRILLLLLSLWFQVNLTSAQELTYDILWGNDSIGVMTSTYSDSAGFVVLHIESHVNIWFMGRKNVYNSYHSILKDGQLHSGWTKYVKNKKLKEKSSIQHTMDGYQIVVNENIIPCDTQSIQQTITKLYQEEPKGVSRVFSERFGQFLALTNPSPHLYLLTKPDGRKNEYIYEKGLCTKVIAHTFFATVVFLKRN